jgi:hypothetical protein
MTVTTVGTVVAYDYIDIKQAIEGLNSAQLAWGTAGAKTITVSFWVRSAVTGTYSIKLNNFGATRNYIASYTISAADTWEKKTITIAGETSGTWLTTNGSGVFLGFTPRVEASSTGAAGAWSSSSTPAGVTGHANAFATVGNIFAITGVQLEANTVATPFEHRPYGTELALCQRYYENSYDNGVAVGTLSTTGSTAVIHSAASGAATGFRFMVRKRVTPAVRGYPYISGTNNGVGFWTSASDATNRAVTFGNISPNGMRFITLTGTTATSWYEGHYEADAEL